MTEKLYASAYGADNEYSYYFYYMKKKFPKSARIFIRREKARLHALGKKDEEIRDLLRKGLDVRSK